MRKNSNYIYKLRFVVFKLNVNFLWPVKVKQSERIQLYFTNKYWYNK